MTELSKRPKDAGSALILTLMVMALVTGLATTVAVVTINNLQSSVRAQQAGSALNAADAGVAQALAYLRTSGVRDLRCSPTCATNPWGNRAAPTSVTVGGVAGQAYRAWIEPVAPYPLHDPGLYRIHSTGTAGGSSSRAVTSDVAVTTTNLAKGVFARTISGGGSASVTRTSVFSTGCVYDRSKIAMIPGEIDLAYGIPVAVHSSQIITESNGTGQYCPTTSKPIHRTGAQNATPRACHPAYPYDQDRLGGALVAGDGCYNTAMTGAGAWARYYAPRDLDGDGVTDVNGSSLTTDAGLLKLFDLTSPALSPTQVDQLRALAQSQGNYWTKSAATQWSSPDESNAVMFFDLTAADPGGTVDLNAITGFGRATGLADTDPACVSKSLVIVVVGGNAKLNSDQQLAASLFLTSPAPHGQVLKANGTATFIGTMYADNINLVGNLNISTDTCFLANVSPSLLSLGTRNYREDDR